MEEQSVDAENRPFNPRRLEKLTLSRRALSLELESSRSSLWNVNDDQGSVSLAPRKSPPRPSLVNLRKIQKMLSSDDVEQAPRHDDGISVLTPGNSSLSEQSLMMAEECPFSPIASSLSPPMRQPVFVKADRSALDAIADLGRRLHRDEHHRAKPIALLQAKSPFLVSRRNACSPTITRLTTLLSPQAGKNSSPQSAADSSRDRSSCSHHSVASSHCTVQDAPSTAPTVTFLSRLLFGTPTKQSEQNNPTTSITTPEPSTPTGMYTTTTSSSVEQQQPHQYLLQLGQILGHSSPPKEQSRLLDEVGSTTSSLSSLGEPFGKSRGLSLLRRSLAAIAVILLLCYVNLVQVPTYGKDFMDRMTNHQGVNWIKIDSGSWERLEGALITRTTIAWRHWNASLRPSLERKGIALYSYWRVSLYPFLLERAREIPVFWHGQDKGSSRPVVRRARQWSASRVQWESGTVALSPDPDVGVFEEIDPEMPMANVESAVWEDSVQYLPASASHVTSALEIELESATRDYADRALSTYVVSLKDSATMEVGDRAVSTHVVSEPLSFWQSSRPAAPFLSTDIHYNRRKAASHSPHGVKWACFLASLRDDRCLNIEKRDFCCESDRTETTIRLPSLEETLKSVEEESDWVLMDVVSEFFRERQRRRLARTGRHVS